MDLKGIQPQHPRWNITLICVLSVAFKKYNLHGIRLTPVWSLEVILNNPQDLHKVYIYIYWKEKEHTALNVPARFAEIWNMLVAILLVNTFGSIFQIIVNASVYSSPLLIYIILWENAYLSTFEERGFQVLHYYDAITGWHITWVSENKIQSKT